VTLPYHFHPAALAEYTAAAVRYGNEGGTRFADLVDRTLDQIREHPNRWPFWPGRTDVRRRTLRRFPYSIVYLVESAKIVIVAVAHHKRRPAYSARRLRRR
jgi:plasmid stabilization system protein ParE